MRNLGLENSDKIKELALKKKKGWCVGPQTSNKFIWVGVTKTQRVSRTVFLRVLSLQDKF